jgi:membrane associated rhomboid family serine protease
MSGDYSRLYRDARRELSANRFGRIWPSPAGRAAVVMTALIGVLWVVELLDALLANALDRFALEPRVIGSLPEVFTAPLVHFGLGHLAANTVPLFVLGFLVALRGLGRFVLVSLVVVGVGGLLTWLTESPGIVGGASGVVFGYFGYLLLRGFVDRRAVDVVVSIGIALAYAYPMWHSIGFGVTNISWQGHLAGLVGGMLAAILLRRGRTKTDTSETQVLPPV